ncbi:hypothetical protein IQ07DRAFT_662986 [Pyrenochaeta sp. DS3sAY3a]|nr:hypothetical protein IQ07DRAFT_662986 [Pyrenochaeta sp. DS3sAY3a]
MACLPTPRLQMGRRGVQEPATRVLSTHDLRFAPSRDPSAMAAQEVLPGRRADWAGPRLLLAFGSPPPAAPPAPAAAGAIVPVLPRLLLVSTTPNKPSGTAPRWPKITARQKTPQPVLLSSAAVARPTDVGGARAAVLQASWGNSPSALGRRFSVECNAGGTANQVLS